MIVKKGEYSVVGKSVPLIDACEKVTGTIKYAGDIRVPGMLTGKILRSPYAHAKIVEIDTSKAEALPGVYAVITHKNIPNKEWLGAWFNRQGKVLDETVRYVGDEVAAVAAEDKEIAEMAIGLIEVEYEKLPEVFDIEEAMKHGAPEVRAGGNAIQRTALSWGDAEKGFEESDFVIEKRCTMGFAHHSPLDRNACIVSWDGDHLTLITGTQEMFKLRNQLSVYFDVPKNYVNVVQKPLGGSFGLWWDMNYHFIAALLARKAGRTVRMELTREEVFAGTKRRERPVTYIKLGFAKNGKLISSRWTHIFDNGAYGFKPDPFQSASDIYRITNGDYEAIGVNTNLSTAGCARGVGDLTLNYAMEQTIDLAAEKLNIDPVEFRKQNHFREGDILWSSQEVFWCKVFFQDKPRPVVKLAQEALDECLEKGAELIQWKKKWKGWGKPVAIEGAKRRGIGVAIATHICGLSMLGPTGAIVIVNTDGTATLTLGPGLMGQGANTTQCQIVAEVLGIPYEDVQFAEPDTLHTPECPSTVGSVTAYMVSPATKAASEDAKNKILKVAASLLDAKSEELDIKEGKIFAKANSEKGLMTVSECLCRPLYDIQCTSVIVGSASMGFPFEKSAKMTMVAFAEVEVDTETGIVKVVDYVQVHDSGRLMNPTICYNQAGGLYMGAGFALGERLIFDEDGKLLNANFMDYKVFGISDMPMPKIAFVEKDEPGGVFGVKGIGEGASCVATPAIASAVYNALGVQIDPPITPDKVLSALGEKL